MICSLRRIVLLGVVAWCGAAAGQVAPYNPYADSHETLPPVAADGTLHWGTFYKSAKIQQTYERLWAMGSCRGTNRAITVPVNENRLVIDRLPEGEFKGVVRASAGQLAGGMIAFDEGTAPEAGREPLVAQFHPAGVTRFHVGGRAAASMLGPGMVVRLITEVDSRGRGKEPVRSLEIVSPPAGFVADAVEAHRRGTVVGTVVSIRAGVAVLRTDTGKLRKITLQLADEADVSVDAARLDLVGAGDTIEVKGRLWTGEGSMGAGTVFVSDVIVTKKPLPGVDQAAAPGPRTVGAR
ncbi:MAG: hypothetical protein ACKOC8_02245 [Pirellulales bacterium]